MRPLTTAFSGATIHSEVIYFLFRVLANIQPNLKQGLFHSREHSAKHGYCPQRARHLIYQDTANEKENSKSSNVNEDEN